MSALAFESHWLALREPADARSRDVGLERRLEDALALRRDPCRGVDLGSGTGANLRHLGPRLPIVRWTAVDKDAEHLDAAGHPAEWRVETRVLDLAEDLEAALTPAPDLVTASAFLDLVSARWVTRLVAASHDSWVLVALTVDGRVALTPELPGDEAVLAAHAADQQTEKLAGQALGGTAAAVLVETARAAGRQTWSAPSDWCLGPDDAPLQRALLEGYARVARRRLPADDVDGWLSRRLDALARGRSRLCVGHRDVLVAPGKASS